MVIYHSKNYNFARYIALLVLSGIQLYYYLIAGILRDILSTETVVPVFGALAFVLIAVSAIFSILHCKEIKNEVRTQSKPVIDNIVVNDVVEKVVKEAIVTGSDDPVTKLKQLKELYDSGIITSEEYESKKKELLTKI
ncbi:MAG: SHOCT domain-containing protein [Bacilli bacterium]|nr:SHOCT domain-containing protein [Bacilli bacterium]